MLTSCSGRRLLAPVGGHALPAVLGPVAEACTNALEPEVRPPSSRESLAAPIRSQPSVSVSKLQLRSRLPAAAKPPLATGGGSSSEDDSWPVPFSVAGCDWLITRIS